MARARLVSLRGSTFTAPLSIFTVTSSGSTTCSWPLGPLTLTVCPSTFAVTPDGIGTGFLPIRDMAFPCSRALEHRAEDFAADILVARIVVRHHAFRRGEDRDAEAVVDARQRLHRRVDATAWLRHAFDLADHRRAVEI